MINRHRIGKLTLEIAAPQQTQGYDQQQVVTDWMLSERLWGELSAMFDRLVPPDQVLSIPTLELTVDGRSEEALRNALIEAFREAIGSAVQHRNPNSRLLSARQHARLRVQHYLQTGRLLWNTPATEAHSLADWFRELLHTPDAEFVLFLREKAGQDSAIWLRFVYALGIENVSFFVLRHLNLSGKLSDWLNESIDYQLPKLTFTEQVTFWQTAFRDSVLAQTDEIAFRNRIQNTLANPPETAQLPPTGEVRNTNLTPTDDPYRVETNRITESDDETGYAVANAGLVLLWQFVPPLFRWLGLIEAGDFRDEEARCRGVHLLQYLATGQTETWEYDLLLNKILCGWDIARPVPNTASLSPQDYAGAEKLLHHVVEKWPVIRSIEALRTTFLQREGTITPSSEGDWQLQVARKTVDILMTRPPKRPSAEEVLGSDELSYPAEWGFSVVKFSWMPRMLFVDW